MARRFWGRLLALAVTAGLASGPAQALDHSLRFRLGLLTLEGESRYWEDKEFDFTGQARDLEDVVAGIDYLVGLGPRTGFMFSLDHYSSEMDQRYRDFVDAAGFPIAHTTSLDITPLTVAVVFQLAPPRSPLLPYVGAGGGLYFWRLREAGEFIDFGVAPPEIFFDRFEDRGQSLGWFFLVGLEVPLGPFFSFIAEARWDRVDDRLKGDFEGFGTLDLSARRLMGGIAWRF
jgi:hypothetical protein